LIVQTITETILSNPLFAALTEKEAEELASHCEVMVLPSNYNLFSQGEISEDMFVLFRGDLELKVKDAAGSEMIIGTLAAGEVFGEMGVLEREPRSASIYTASDSVVLRIPGDGFHSMVSTGHPAIHILLKYTMTKACTRLRELDNRFSNLLKGGKA